MSKTEWKEYNFDEICINFDKKRIPLSSQERSGRQGSYRYFGAQGVIDYIDDFIFDGDYILLAEDGENLKSRKQSLVQRVSGKFWVNNHAHILSGNEICSTEFLYYLLTNLDFTPFITGSAQPKLSQQSLSKIFVKVPPLAEQQRIAKILSSLDEKIELNNVINRNLEEQVKTLYTKLFVKERNGKESLLGELISIKYGKDHKKLSDGQYPVYGSGGIMRYVDQFLYDQESVLIPRKGSLNNVMYVNEPFWSVDTMFYTEMKRPNIAKYIFIFLSDQNLESLNAGSAVPSMTTDILNAMKILIPDDDVLTEFEDIAAPIYRKITDNTRENKELASIRDSLLPRLMSGDLEV